MIQINNTVVEKINVPAQTAKIILVTVSIDNKPATKMIKDTTNILSRNGLLSKF